MSLFRTEGLTIRFGGLVAVDEVNLAVERGETVGLIGPNGSGKTTFFNLVTGIYQPSAGDLFFRKESLLGLEAHQISRRGIARTFQASRLCLRLSVFDNILIGMHGRQECGVLHALFQRRRFLREVHAAIDEASALLQIFNPGLVAQGFERVAGLPQIDRRRVEICRALAARPHLLLLDEPSAGMNPEETLTLMKDLTKVRDRYPGISLLIIEHDMFVIEGISDRVVAFNYGKKIAEGAFREVAANEEVREAYLGTGEAAHA
ncbi:MAG: ABC transporter ATP-binding protein [Candidatus Methylomirabilales bacterium]